jgi:hypothetical protein
VLNPRQVTGFSEGFRAFLQSSYKYQHKLGHIFEIYYSLSLRTWERKVLTKIYGPGYDNGIWRIRTNKELTALYQELDIVAEIKKARLRWLGHVERM